MKNVHVFLFEDCGPLFREVLPFLCISHIGGDGDHRRALVGPAFVHERLKHDDAPHAERGEKGNQPQGEGIWRFGRHAVPDKFDATRSRSNARSKTQEIPRCRRAYKPAAAAGVDSLGLPGICQCSYAANGTGEGPFAETSDEGLGLIGGKPLTASPSASENPSL
jgi:hypothetical protein